MRTVRISKFVNTKVASGFGCCDGRGKDSAKANSTWSDKSEDDKLKRKINECKYEVTSWQNPLIKAKDSALSSVIDELDYRSSKSLLCTLRAVFRRMVSEKTNFSLFESNNPKIVGCVDERTVNGTKIKAKRSEPNFQADKFKIG